MTMRRNSRLGVVALFFMALPISACSSGSDEQRDPPSSSLPLGTSKESEQIDPGAPAVTYSTEQRFSPKRLEIEPGQQVRFVNGSDKPFWQTSNIHPTRTILSELDAKTPIPPGETWELTFNNRGSGASTTTVRQKKEGW